MTHAPIKPFWVVKNKTGDMVYYHSDRGVIESIWSDELAAGTYRIEGPFGGDVETKRKVVQACPVRCEGGWDNLVLIHDDGSMVLVDGSTIPFNPKAMELLIQVGEDQPSEPAQDLRAELRALRQLMDDQWKLPRLENEDFYRGVKKVHDFIAKHIDALLSRAGGEG